MTLTASAQVPAQMLERARAAYARDVAILPAPQVAGLIETAGFEAPVQFFQAGLMHGWFCPRKALIEASQSAEGLSRTHFAKS